MEPIWNVLRGWLLAGVCLVPAAHAQSLHILADPAFPAVDEEIRVRLMGGAPFQGEELMARDLRHGLLQQLWRSGRVNLGADPAPGSTTIRPTRPGVQVIALFPRGADGAADRQRSASYAKAVLVVGQAAAGEKIWRSELGQRLEIVPQTDPVRLREQGGVFEVQVLLDREPLPGATVAATAEDAPAESYTSGATDDLGYIRFELDRPGRWLIHLAHKRLERGPEPGWILLQSSLTLTAGPQP